MAFVSRESIFSALYNLFADTEPPGDLGWNYTGRDLLSWDDVPAANQPALFLVETPQHASQPEIGLEQWKLGAAVFIYFRRDSMATPDPDNPRDKTVNQFIDVIDAALAPPPGWDRQTLNGLVYHTYIDGAVVFDNGLTDSQAVIVIPITMLVGAFGA